MKTTTCPLSFNKILPVFAKIAYLQLQSTQLTIISQPLLVKFPKRFKRLLIQSIPLSLFSRRLLSVFTLQSFLDQPTLYLCLIARTNKRKDDKQRNQNAHDNAPHQNKVRCFSGRCPNEETVGNKEIDHQDKRAKADRTHHIATRELIIILGLALKVRTVLPQFSKQETIYFLYQLSSSISYINYQIQLSFILLKEQRCQEKLSVAEKSILPQQSLRTNLNFIYIMLSNNQLQSLLRYEDAQAEDTPQQKRLLLDVSHQELRKLQQLDLPQLSINQPVDRINASYNYFKHFDSLNIRLGEGEHQVFVKWIDLSFNFLEQVDAMGERTNLLTNLEYLNLTANRIQSVDFTNHSLSLLQTLVLSSNRIKFFLHCPENLKVLTLDNNQLSALAFTGGDNLTVLSARNNTIRKLGVNFGSLMLFDVERNLIDDLEMVKELLNKNKQLLSVNFRENPVAKFKNYKVTILQFGEEVTQIDDVIINPHIREGFKVLKAESQLNDLIDSANQKYSDRLAQKQRIKNELIKKIKNQQKQVEERFHEGIKDERQQFELLQQHAKEVVGRKALNVPCEKDQFHNYLKEYSQEETPDNFGEIKQDKNQVIQQQHTNQYLAYMQKKKMAEPLTRSKFTPPPRQREPLRNRTSQLMSVRPVAPQKSKEQNTALKNLQLFDNRCIDSLLKDYVVDTVDM